MTRFKGSSKNFDIKDTTLTHRVMNISQLHICTQFWILDKNVSSLSLTYVSSQKVTPQSAAQHTRIKVSRYVYGPFSQLLLRVCANDYIETILGRSFCSMRNLHRTTSVNNAKYHFNFIICTDFMEKDISRSGEGTLC